MLEFIKKKDKGFNNQEYLARTLDEKKDLLIENFLLYVDKTQIKDESILMIYSCSNSYEPRIICYTNDDSLMNKRRKKQQVAELMQVISKIFYKPYDFEEEVAATKE